MRIQSREVPLHLNVLETSKGKWLIEVGSVAEAQGGESFLLKLSLETGVNEDGERIRTRELGISIPASKLFQPDLLADVLQQIRNWIETTEGDGFLEFTNR